VSATQNPNVQFVDKKLWEKPGESTKTNMPAHAATTKHPINNARQVFCDKKSLQKTSNVNNTSEYVSTLRGTRMKWEFFVFLAIAVVASTSIAIQPVKATEDSWASKAPMQVSRSGFGIAVLDNRIWVIGGYPARNINEQYDPVNDSWTTMAPLPTGREVFGIASCKNKIYVIGGTTNEMASGVTGVNEVYDPITDTWETKTPMPTPRFELQANVVNDKIYLIGGRTASQYSTVNKTEVYEPTTDSWTTKASMPYPVVMYASAVVNNKIYIFGGQDEFSSSMNLPTTQIYDPATDTWSLGKDAPKAIWQASAGATTGQFATKRIYLMGGEEGFMVPLSQNFVYDPEADVWSAGALMPTARFSFGIAVVNDLLYAIGGIGWNFGQVYGTNEQYTPIGYGTPDPSYKSPLPSPSSTPTVTPTQIPTPTQSSTLAPSLTPTPTITEFPSWIILPLVLASTLITVLFVKWRMKAQNRIS
jgi:N-acetylneuraminic acid mutarotase